MVCNRMTEFCSTAAQSSPNLFSILLEPYLSTPVDSLCVSRKGGTGGGGWVHPEGVNSMAVSGLACE